MFPAHKKKLNQNSIRRKNKKMITRQVGVEPTAFCLGNRRSIHWATGACISLRSYSQLIYTQDDKNLSFTACAVS